MAGSSAGNDAGEGRPVEAGVADVGVAGSGDIAGGPLRIKKLSVARMALDGRQRGRCSAMRFCASKGINAAGTATTIREVL